MAMGRRRKRKKANEQNVSAFVEECANEVFAGAAPEDFPIFTHAYELWGRMFIAASLQKNASDVPLRAMESVRRKAQSTYRQPIALVLHMKGPAWTLQNLKDGVVALMEEHGV